jgi:hypothetical protein
MFDEDDRNQSIKWKNSGMKIKDAVYIGHNEGCYRKYKGYDDNVTDYTNLSANLSRKIQDPKCPSGTNKDPDQIPITCYETCKDGFTYSKKECTFKEDSYKPESKAVQNVEPCDSGLREYQNACYDKSAFLAPFYNNSPTPWSIPVSIAKSYVS